MFNSVVTHWKTSLTGLVAGASQISVHGMTFKQYALAFAVAALGLLAKDGNKQ